MDLSGLTPRKVARGALTCPEFQNMLDPLDRDPFGPVVVKAECEVRGPKPQTLGLFINLL